MASTEFRIGLHRPRSSTDVHLHHRSCLSATRLGMRPSLAIDDLNLLAEPDNVKPVVKGGALVEKLD